MPNCKCGHSAAQHCWKREVWGECSKCYCLGYKANAYQPSGFRVPSPRVNNPYIRKLRRRKR